MLPRWRVVKLAAQDCVIISERRARVPTTPPPPPRRKQTNVSAIVTLIFSDNSFSCFLPPHQCNVVSYDMSRPSARSSPTPTTWRRRAPSSSRTRPRPRQTWAPSHPCSSSTASNPAVPYRSQAELELYTAVALLPLRALVLLSAYEFWSHYVGLFLSGSSGEMSHSGCALGLALSSRQRGGAG